MNTFSFVLKEFGGKIINFCTIHFIFTPVFIVCNTNDFFNIISFREYRVGKTTLPSFATAAIMWSNESLIPLSTEAIVM